MEDGRFGDLRPGTWELGEIKECETPKNAPALMVCGRVARMALAEAEMYVHGDATEPNSPAREAIWAEHQMFDVDATTYEVRLNGSGWTWCCKKTTDGIDCNEWAISHPPSK